MLRRLPLLVFGTLFLLPALVTATPWVEPPPPDDDTPAKTTDETKKTDAGKTKKKTTKRAIDPVEDLGRKLTSKLCKIVMTGNRRAFEYLLHSEAPKDSMRYWWYASSKAVHFRELFSKCTFTHVDRRKTETDSIRIKIFIKRWVKRVNRYTDPAPVRFKKDPKANNEWKLVGYSL
jgi:hypothetical protein